MFQYECSIRMRENDSVNNKADLKFNSVSGCCGLFPLFSHSTKKVAGRKRLKVKEKTHLQNDARDGWFYCEMVSPPHKRAKYDAVCQSSGAEHPWCGHPTWVCEDSGTIEPLRLQSNPPLHVLMSLDDRHTEQRWKFTWRWFLWFLWITIFHLIPHCSRFIAAQERRTNNTASLLVHGWARDQPEPITARQYYMCVVSQ